MRYGAVLYQRIARNCILYDLCGYILQVDEQLRSTGRLEFGFFWRFPEATVSFRVAYTRHHSIRFCLGANERRNNGSGKP